MGQRPALSPERVKLVRRAYDRGTITLKMLAKMEKVSHSTIFKAVNRISPYDRAPKHEKETR